MVKYLEFIEEHQNKSVISLFDKVRVIASRTRDLYDGKSSKALTEHDLENRKPHTVAHYEVIKGYIEADIHEKEEKSDDFMDEMEME